GKQAKGQKRLHYLQVSDLSRENCVNVLRDARSRHIKCDEAKPSCLKCLASHRTCGGYPSPFWPRNQLSASAAEKEVGIQDRHALSGPESDLSLEIHSVLGLPSDLQDRRAFAHFRHRSAFDLSSYLDDDFWNAYVLRLSASSNVIQHGLLALSAQHEAYLQSKVSDGHSPGLSHQSSIVPYSIKHYQHAVRALNERLSDQKQTQKMLEETLVACILFIGMEILQEEDLPALIHLEGGLKILSNNMSSSLADEEIASREMSPLLRLAKMFTRLDVQAASYIPSRISQPLQRYGRLDKDDCLPSWSLIMPFDTLLVARDALDTIRTKIYYFTRAKVALYQRLLRSKGESHLQPVEGGDPSSSSQNETQSFNSLLNERATFMQNLANWRARFESLTAQSSHGKGEISALWLAYLSILITLSACLDDRETAYDVYLSHFQDITSHAQVILTPHETQTKIQSSPQPFKRGFSLETKVIQPLFFTALKCREYHTRVEAIALLRRCGKEGPWDGDIEAAIASYAMYVEELQRDLRLDTFGIPERARIRNVELIHIDRAGRRVWVRCSTRDFDYKVRDTFNHTLSAEAMRDRYRWDLHERFLTW
ncbi:MAG: hypothetical protein Q9214_005946, partial [Letrouitia sp. 1 TL-2023]